MKNLLLAYLLLTQSLSASAQAPSWVNYVNRTTDYPESTHLVGYIAENNINDQNPEELLQRLSGFAKDQLVENILVDIKSISTLNIHNVNAETQETFKRNSTSVSNATIAGLKTETYYNKKKKTAYAIATAKKKDVIKHYANEIANSLDQINTTYEITKNQIEAGNNQKALKSLFQVQTAIKNVEHSLTMLVTLSGDFNHPGLKRNEINRYKVQLDKDLNDVRNTEQFSLEDAAFYIAHALHTQLDDKATPILVNNFSYQDTPMSSAFSRRLQASISQKLVSQGFIIATQGQQDKNSFVLSGTYWEEGNRLKVSALLRNQNNGAAISSAECYLPKETVTNLGITFTPENYKQAMVNMKMFAANEMKGGALQLELFTNKGKDNLIFSEGEMLKLFVKANRECYLRFIYHLADGSKVMLLDNYYIDRDHVNQVYELPYEFECADPFGVETLQLNAQGNPFEALYTKSEYGYDFIIEDTQSIITKTRGFKKAKSSDDIKAEKRLIFTTMNK